MKRQTTKTTTPALTTVPANKSKRETLSRALAPAQQFIADEVADMLVNGGAEEFTDLLISAAARHAFWRWASSLHGPQEQDRIKKAVADLGYRRFQDLKTEMIAAWREQRRAPKETARPEPKTVAERIRANILGDLRRAFWRFLTEATPEECRLMLDVLRDHESANHGRCAFDELPLGRAFDYVLGKAAPDWVKVPEEIRGQVDSYIKWAQDVETPENETEVHA
jgi:hypothetical protein